ncbi:hypothetical protein HID58_042773, partial [Brassica napus]
MVLWGKIATDVTNSIQLRSEKRVIFVLRFWKIKVLKEDRSVLNAYNFSNVQLNPNMVGVEEFRALSRTAPRLNDFVLSILPSMFPHLVATFMAACVSVTLPFAIVLLRICSVDLEDCFLSQVWALVSQGLASVLPHSGCSLLPLLPLSFVVLHLHRRLVCACLVC